MKIRSFLIKPSGPLCNLSCKYCFYRDVAKYREVKGTLMNDEVTKTLIDKALNNADHLFFAFQGGEPMVAGLEYFKKFVNYVNKKKNDYQIISYSLQTNGTLFTDEWYPFLKENKFLVGISLDGHKDNNDYFRTDETNNGTYNTIINTIENLKKYEIEYNVLSVLTSKLAENPIDFYNSVKEIGAEYVQIIPCIAPFQEDNEYSLKPELFFSFNRDLFDMWLKDFKNGSLIDINTFTNYSLLLKGYLPTQCGFYGKCNFNYIVESNGDIYPCDFYCTDDYLLGNILKDDLDKIISSKKTLSFLYSRTVLPEPCYKCRYFNICEGSCKRMEKAYINKDYCGIRSFLDYAKDELIKI